MNVLIDTNIIIKMEDTGKLLSAEMAEFKRLCSNSSTILYYHPIQIEDILRDKDDKRKEVILSRIKQYNQIKSPPTISDKAFEELQLKQNSENDRIDNALIYTVYIGAAHFLVTNDLGIHTKARQLGCPESVFRPDQFLQYLRKRTTDKTPQPPPGLVEKYLYEIDIHQSFFDSLRKSYNDFNGWFKRASKEHRKTWCILNTKNQLQAICIYKEEENEIITDNGYPISGKLLKLCTLKVSEEVRGRKYGERLLFSAFKYASEKRLNWVYLHTHGKEHKLLISLCEDYGFSICGKYKGDDVLLKPMDALDKKIPALEYAIQYYPNFLRTDQIQYFIVPIKGNFHNDLFADSCEIADSLFKDDPTMYSSSMNTIKKAYISHSNIKTIKPGDVLLFYRSGDRQNIEVVGIAEKIVRTDEFENVLALVTKRTVYTIQEIKNIVEKECLVILFRVQQYLTNFIDRKRLLDSGITGNIQTIRKITYNQFKEIYNEKRE
jgi:predicted nucleic acid-binding protein/GNAT superfamily N-acetyltransferase